MSAPGDPHPPPVLRNAIWLIGAQVLGAPISVLINVVAGRYLGPAEFGTLYLAMTYSSFALLFVEWGQFGALTGKIAGHRARAGELLGSAMLWRIAASSAVAVIVLLLCAAVGYGRSFLSVMALALAAAGLGTVAAAGQDAVRGFERTDFAALSYVGQQLLVAGVSITVLLLGFGLRGLLLGQILCATIGVMFVLWMLPRLQISNLSVRYETIKELVRDGRAFLVFVLVLQLQPLVDGAMMSRFASADAIGWYAASRKLVGALMFPVSAVGSALYPTLVRQFANDMPGFGATVRSALNGLCLIVFPLALGCVLFPHLGVMIFNSHTFAPAEQNLRLLGVYLFLLYFSIPLSQCITSTGRQARWTAVQCLCVVISAVADPLLIPWFEVHAGNGGLGVCVAAVGSEILMVFGAVLLVPKGVLDASLLRMFVKPALGGLAMAAVGLWVGRYSELLGAILAVLAYALVLWLTGALNAQVLRTALAAMRRRRA